MSNCRVEWLWLVSPLGDGHVQQCLGLRAARTSLESVWSAGRRRGCRQQRRWEIHTKNYSPVTIFHFFDVLWSMRMWVCYLMQSCLLPPPVVLLSLLIHVFFLIYFKNIFVFLSCQMWRRLPEPCRGPKETPKRRKRTMRTWVWIRAHTTN